MRGRRHALADVRVGVQVRSAPTGLVPGDAPSARWDVDVSTVVDASGQLDVRGPAVHGKRGDRFLYLNWVNVDAHGDAHMFRRAKLMLNRVDPGLLDASTTTGRSLVATVVLTDERGGPRCARVDPPAVTWALG